MIKLGGALLADEGLPASFWEAVQVLQAQAPVVIVHGGGPQLTDVARRLQHEPRIVQGRRVTTDTDLEIVHWTLRGALNVQLVARATRFGLRAAGISGVDGAILQVRRRPPWNVEGETVDFGWVGDVERIDTALVRHLFAGGYLPILAPLGIDEAGQTYNVNADTVACALAGALGAAQFLLVTEAGGVRRDPADPKSLLASCDRATFAAGTEHGWIQGGMRVKLKVAFDALDAGVPEVFILAPDDLIPRARGTQAVGRSNGEGRSPK